jgi:hypothetical protein
MMAKPGVGSKPVIVQIIGDSFTHGKFYEYALLDSGLVPNIKMVGLLKARDGQYNEGRGGWALSTYFNVPKRDDRSYHGFMQPEEGRYWGTRGFWRMAWRCTRKTQPKGFEPTYSCARFDDYVKNFDEKTGVLLNPQTGDMQYDPETKTMYRFDSKSWVETDISKIKWGFDYGKYLEMWKIEPPQFLFVLLGLNDFRGSLTADFTQWGKNITAMKESYLKACPNGKFVICIPCSSCGSLDIYKIVKALADNDFDGYVRPDHGRMIWGETGKPGYGLFDRALGAAYINGLFEACEKEKELN